MDSTSNEMKATPLVYTSRIWIGGVSWAFALGLKHERGGFLWACGS